ncbi:hypothetical protein [Actinoplanes regularis]|uniref:hypothetical protein n=1 Tax=Actinoplanes regularis TaxID=52697 RepID=UPI0024A37C1A|nr:hypothetical protein [Actinoplanes regularis]GLW35357.1 hypothetical protein Areg01_82930 [Actinoplanes regularis]
MQKIDTGVVGRGVAVGAVTGAVTGFTVLCLFLVGGLLVSGYRDDEIRMTGNMSGFVLAAIVGALVGAITGFVAGLVLMPAAARLRRRPVLGRSACAAACGAAMSLPFLVAGVGWDNWPDPPLSWAAIALVALTGAIGAWKSGYILAGRAATVAAPTRTLKVDP